MRYEVYVLIDPESLEPRYVGMTGSGLAHRLQGHITDAQRENRNKSGPSPKDHWLRALAARGDTPIITRLAVYDSREAAIDAERTFKRLYRERGFDIVRG